MYINKTPILKMVDLFTHLTMARILHDKSAQSVISALQQTWFDHYGAPKCVLSDPGGENISDTTLSMFATWNITPLLTPAQSPQSNSLCERIGGILRTVVEKLQTDNPQQSLSQHLTAATFAHNSLISSHGHSPHMLVTGTTLRFPGLMNDNLAAMSARLDTPNQRVQLLHKARVIYTQSLHCASLTKAIMTQVAKKPTPVVEHGNHVFFWNQNTFGGTWKGPGIVVGTNPDAHSVLIRYGDKTYDRHISAVRQAHFTPNSPSRLAAHTSPVTNPTHPTIEEHSRTDRKNVGSRKSRNQQFCANPNP